MYIDDIYISLKLDAGVQSLTFLKRKEVAAVKRCLRSFTESEVGEGK